MASLTPAELSDARRRSGRLGGRPPTPTVAEARQAKLEELVPKALRVIEANLAAESEQVRQRAAEHILDRAWGKPTLVTEQVPPPDFQTPWEGMTPEAKRVALALLTTKMNGASAG